MSLGFLAAAQSPPAAPANLTLLTDEQLLSRFFKYKDDSAFETIVKRHGPVVYGVCRRVLADSNDAEDAFQATFLVLVRKGASLRQPGRLSSWLYGVANRTARKFRLKSALRTRSEQQAGQRLQPADVSELKYDELRTILDEEIAQLPEKYALPLVLCYLEGKTNAEAAEQLGWPEGSMSRRLSRGRELLKKRLTRRGLAITAALIAAAFARPAEAAIPAALADATAQAGHLVLSGARLEHVVSQKAAKIVAEVIYALSAPARTTGAAVLAAASILLVLTTAIWQFGNEALGASGFDLRRDPWIHGLVSNPPQANYSRHVLVEEPAGCCSIATSAETLVTMPTSAPLSVPSLPAAPAKSERNASNQQSRPPQAP